MKRVWIPSPNFSSRGGSAVRLIVVHTAEGSQNFRDLGAFFASPSSGVSSHTGIDDTPGEIGSYVQPEMKAWTQANANPYCVSTELCAFAEWSTQTWMNHPVMLENCAAWIREEAARYGIPIVKLTSSQAQGGSRGVCGHVDLGAAGGGHWDPGNATFPWSHVIDLAKGGGGGSSAPPPPLVRHLIATHYLEDEPMPDYVINDVANGSRKFGVYASGLVRRLPGPEFKHCRDALKVPVIELHDSEEGDRYYQYDQALRGLTKERE